MCWMAARVGPEAASRALKAVSKREQMNGHSWGVAYLDNGAIKIKKAVGEIPREVLSNPPKSQAAIAHTRLATRGTVNYENAHPFPIYDTNDEVIGALCHNGTWHDAPRSERCDSYHIAKLLGRCYRRRDPARDGPNENPFKTGVRAAGQITGETFLVLQRNGEVHTHSGRYPMETAGDAFQTDGLDGGESVPTGRVRTISYTGDTTAADNATLARYD